MPLFDPLLYSILHLQCGAHLLNVHSILRTNIVKCYIWSKALCGAETGTLRTVDQKQLEGFEIWLVLEKEGKDQLDRSCEK